MSLPNVLAVASSGPDGRFFRASYACPIMNLCLAVDHMGQLWRLGNQNWEQYEPDLLELALTAQLVELEIIEKLVSYPRKPQRDMAAGVG